MSTKGVISRHLEELMKVQTSLAAKPKSSSTEKISKPPKPSSPPRLILSPELNQTNKNPGSARIDTLKKPNTQCLSDLNISWQVPEKSILDLEYPKESPSSLE